MLVPCIFLVGFAFYTVLVAKKWKRVNAVSTAEMFGQRYSRGMQLFASAIDVFTLLILCSCYLKAAAVVFETAFGASLTTTIVVVCTVVLGFTLAGGLVSVVWTDLASFVVTVVTLPILFIVCLRLLMRSSSGIRQSLRVFRTHVVENRTAE